MEELSTETIIKLKFDMNNKGTAFIIAKERWQIRDQYHEFFQKLFVIRVKDLGEVMNSIYSLS